VSIQPETELPAKRRRSLWRRTWGVGVVALAVTALLALGYTPGPERPYAVEKIRTLRLKTEPSAVAWSPDGKQLAALSHLFMHMTVWNTDTWEVANEFDISQSLLSASWLTFTPDSRFILVAADPSDVVNKHATAAFWDVATGKLTQYVAAPFQGGDPRANIAKVITLSRDGTRIALNSNDRPENQLVIYSDRAWDRPILFTLEKDLPERMEFSPDGRLLAIASFGGLLYFFDLETGKPLQRLQIYDFHGTGVSSLAISPDGRFVATGYGSLFGRNPDYSAKNAILLIEASTGTTIAKSSALVPQILDISWSSDGKLLAAGDDIGHVSLLMPPTLEKAASDISLGGPAMSVKFAPDRPVFAATSGKNVAIYAVAHR
jgi:WD40 repeat protein